MAATEALTRGCCLLPLVGPNGSNKIVFKVPRKAGSFRGTVIFFAGDIQKTDKEMTSQFKPYSLDAVVDNIAQMAPQQLVIAVMPSRMEQNTFSCYDHFVQSNQYGAPTHHPGGNGRAALQIHGLLLSLGRQLDM